MRKHILAIAFLAICPLLQAQQDLNNAAIVKMIKAGLSPEIVVATVNSQPGHYNVSPDGLIALKKAGVSDQIISAMIAKNSGSTPPSAAPFPAAAGNGNVSFAPNPSTGPGSGQGSGFGDPSASGTAGVPPGVDSVGMYYKDKQGNWTELGAEVVNFKTGGALKHISSVGIVKEDLNGFVSGFHSHQPMNPPADFILYVPEGVSPGEYQLIRFRINSDSREFRSLTGGAVHTKGGAARDTVDFTTKKIAPRVYEIIVGSDVGKGEYGFLPPQESGNGKNLESSGKIYTFSIAE